MAIRIYVELAEDVYPAYKVREFGDPPINKISERMITVHKQVFYRWLRTITEYAIVQEEIAKKLEEQRSEDDD